VKETGCAVVFKFNGIVMVVSHDDSQETVENAYMESLEAARKAYWTPEQLAEKHAKETRDNAELAEHIKTLSSLDFKDAVAPLTWLCKLQELGDMTYCKFDTQLVIKAFATAGYTAGMNCDDKSNEKDQENYKGYIIGNALDGIQTIGCPHQVLHHFTEKYQNIFSLNPGEKAKEAAFKSEMQKAYEQLPEFFKKWISKMDGKNYGRDVNTLIAKDAHLVATTLKTPKAIEAWYQLRPKEQMRAVPGLNDGHGQSLGQVANLAIRFLKNQGALGAERQSSLKTLAMQNADTMMEVLAYLVPRDWPKAKSLVDRVCKTLSKDPNGRDIADYGNRLDKLADSLTNEHQDIARSLRDSASKIRNSDHRTNLTGK
jgi:hypothetical protein